MNKTKGDWEKFHKFCMENTNNCLSMNRIDAAEPDKLLAMFFKDVRKKDGNSLSSFQRSVQRYFTDNKIPFNILKDDAFTKSRAVLIAKRKNLVKQGRGNKPKAGREITDKEEGTWFETGQFGCDNPVVLQRALWWHLSMHFAFRARDESRKLCWVM